MEVRKKITVAAEDGAANDAFAPRSLTLAENAILTIKVLSVLGLVGAAIWGVNLWTSVK